MTKHHAGSLVAAVAIAALATTITPPAGAQIVDGRILFTNAGENNRNTAIYSVNPDGTGLRKELRNAHVATWSPNGTRIAFARPDKVDRDLYVMDVGGRKATRLTNDSLDDFAPDWSVNGQIVWSKTNDLWVMNENGSGQTELLNETEAVSDPAWSPTASQIAFSSGAGEGSGRDIWIMNAEGTQRTRLTHDARNPGDDETDPAWSPNGEWIAYEYTPNEFSPGDAFRVSELWVIKADGSGQQHLFSIPERDVGNPTWSPGGGRIAFECRAEDQTPLICVIDVSISGGTVTASNQQFITTAGLDSSPDWAVAV